MRQGVRSLSYSYTGKARVCEGALDMRKQLSVAVDVPRARRVIEGHGDAHQFAYGYGTGGIAAAVIGADKGTPKRTRPLLRVLSLTAPLPTPLPCILGDYQWSLLYGQTNCGQLCWRSVQPH